MRRDGRSCPSRAPPGSPRPEAAGSHAASTTTSAGRRQLADGAVDLGPDLARRGRGCRWCSTTPTTSTTCSAPGGFTWSCLPTAFCPGQASRARVSSTIDTGGVRPRRPTVKARPASEPRVHGAEVRRATRSDRPPSRSPSSARSSRRRRTARAEPLPVSGSCEMMPDAPHARQRVEPPLQLAQQDPPVARPRGRSPPAARPGR